MHVLRLPLVAALVLVACARAGEPQYASGVLAEPLADAAASLLAADRALGARASDTTMIDALARTFDDDVFLPAPGADVPAHGREAALAALGRNPANAGSRIEWTPVRAGVSADATHGFTYGFLTVTRPDGARVPGRYVAYWVRRADGWRVLMHKRSTRAAGDVPLAERPPVLPPRSRASANARQVAEWTRELADAERRFSRDAQGGPLIGEAFRAWGDPQAVNSGGRSSADFVHGPDAIGRDVQGGVPSGTQITWEPMETRVAGSGDLGVTIGVISVGPSVGPMRRIPYATIWRRDDPRQPWRYIAE